MINVKIPMKILNTMQKHSRSGTLNSEEKIKISEACKKYLQFGDDDELYDFLDEVSAHPSVDVSKDFLELKEEFYGATQ